MAVKTATKPAPSARTVGRTESPAVAAAVAAQAPPARGPERDPNKIYTRDGRVVDVQRVINQEDDRFNLEKLGIKAPPGWTYEWRVVKIKGAEATRQMVDDEARGWTPVPASRHPGTVMPLGYDGPMERDGLMIKERDARLTALARASEKKSAAEQLNISKSMTGLMARFTPNVADIFDATDAAALRGTGVKTERIPMGEPNKNYVYTLDE